MWVIILSSTLWSRAICWALKYHMFDTLKMSSILISWTFIMVFQMEATLLIPIHAYLRVITHIGFESKLSILHMQNNVPKRSATKWFFIPNLVHSWALYVMLLWDKLTLLMIPALPNFVDSNYPSFKSSYDTLWCHFIVFSCNIQPCPKRCAFPHLTISCKHPHANQENYNPIQEQSSLFFIWSHEECLWVKALILLIEHAPTKHCSSINLLIWTDNLMLMSTLPTMIVTKASKYFKAN